MIHNHLILNQKQELMKINKDLVIDWRVVIFFILLILLPFVIFSSPLKTNRLTNVFPVFFLDDTTGHFIATFDEDDTLNEDYPAVYSSITFALDTIPSDTVIVTAFPDAQLNLGAGAGMPVTLIFPPYPVAITPQEIKVKPVDDAEYEDLHFGNITFTFSTTDSSYAGLVLDDIQYLIIDNELLPGINSIIDSDTFLTEGLTGVDIFFSLNSVPTDSVFITIDPDVQLRITGIPGESVDLIFPPNTSSLSFKDVNVRAVDDVIFEGDHSGNVQFIITTADAVYSTFSIADLSYSIYDNDSAPGINFSIPDTLALTEGSGEIPVIISLNSVPSDTVYINVIPDEQLRIGGAAGEPTLLIFPPNTSALNDHMANIQTYDDAVFEGDHIGEISFEIITSDPDYALFTLDPFSINISDNDLPPGISFSDTTFLAGVEGDSSLFFNLVLTSIPQSTVTINLDPDVQLDMGKGRDIDVNYKFKVDSALISQVVNVYTYDDLFDEGDHIGIINCSISATDTIYAAFIIPDIIVDITDNDGVTIISYDPFSFNIFPSLSTGIISYAFAEFQNETIIKVYNLSGNLIYDKIISSPNGQLDISHFSSGSYYLLTEINNKQYYCRVEIIH